VLSQLAADGQARIVGWDLARGSGEREVVHVQEDNLLTAGTLELSGPDGAAPPQRMVVRLATLPLVDKIPPYTTWIFLDKYSVASYSLCTSSMNLYLGCSSVLQYFICHIIELTCDFGLECTRV
jgi:hypothetical protein